MTDPKCTYEETCFYAAHDEMPIAEQIATALLQLRNNPALFDRWAHQCGLAGAHPGSGLEIETQIPSPSGRGRSFFLTSLFIELIDPSMAFLTLWHSLSSFEEKMSVDRSITRRR
jgi:hypothetical protein